MRHLLAPLAAALTLAFTPALTTGAALASPVDPDQQPLCDRLSALGACFDEACVCTIENAVGSEDTPALRTAHIMKVAHPKGINAAYHLIIRTNGAWKDYGAIFNTFEAHPDGSQSMGKINRFWMKYGVANFGTVLVCDFETSATFADSEANVRRAVKIGGLVYAFVHQGELRVQQIMRSFDQTVSRIDKKGPRPDKNTHGAEGRTHWKRQVEVLDNGRVRVTRATGNDPRLKRPHQLVGTPVLDIMHAFDDEVVTLVPSE